LDYPPGLLNMTAKVNLKEGKKMLWFVFGAVIIIFFQAYLAILFARVIDIRPDI
jgi:Na+/glutamate symporter